MWHVNQMNTVQPICAPPRFLALCLGVVIFAIYHFGWRPQLLAPVTFGTPAPLVLAIIFALILGYGLAALWWLLRSTKGQVWATLRPTRGRIIGAVCLALIIPFAVFSYIPWVLGGLLPFLVGTNTLWALAILLVASCICYPFAAMIVRHTYERRLFRFELFMLAFWAAYAAHMLNSGVVNFTI